MTNSEIKKYLKKVKSLLMTKNVDFVVKLRKLIGEPTPKEEFFRKYKELKEIYDSIGKTPTDEPELAVSSDELAAKWFVDVYIDKISKEKNINLSGYTREVKEEFAYLVSDRVNSIVENSHYKYIGKFKNIDFNNLLINSLEISLIVKEMENELKPIRKEKDTKLKEIIENFDFDIDDVSEFEIEKKIWEDVYDKKIRGISDKYNDMARNRLLELLKVDESDFTEWELKLLINNAYAMIGYRDIEPFIKEEL